MSEESLNLILAVFNDTETAEFTLQQLPKRDTRIKSAVVMQKDAEEKVTFHDVGMTPKKGAISGLVIGGIVGLLTGGAGLALGALGGVAGHHTAKKHDAKTIFPEQLAKVAGSLGPDSSAIIAVVSGEPRESSVAIVRQLGGEVYQAPIAQEAKKSLEDETEDAYEVLLAALAEKTGGDAKITVPYQKIHVVVNPVSGKDQPILNVLNAVFYKYGIDWDISITQKFGDATEFARQAALSGYDLVAGYGGDGTQHEIANGVMGTGVPMAALPGGTGNGFGNEMGIPTELRAAVEMICTSYNQRKIDIAELEAGYFVQRLFTGIEPEEQTSREEKNRYGTFAYLVRDIKRLSHLQDIPYRLKIDGEDIEIEGYKCYVVNSATAGTGLSISRNFAVDDGYLDVFMLSRNPQSSSAAVERFLGRDTENANMYYWRGREIEIDAEVDQPVWTDGEYTGRTPVRMKVIHAGLTVAVP